MPAALDFLSAALYVPRRNALITADVEAALQQLAGAGFSFDARGQMRVVTERRIPQATGETTGGRILEGAVSVDQAISQLRRISADYWGQIMIRGTFAIGGSFEDVTAVVCPFSSNSPALCSVHVLFRKPGLLLGDRPAEKRAPQAVEALDRLQDSFAPVIGFLDSEQPEVDVRSIKSGRLPWLPWAGYLSPGAIRALGGGVLESLPDWLVWLESALKAKGASAARRTKGGGLIWVLPKRDVGQGVHGPTTHIALEPWRQYLSRAIA